MTTKIHFDVLAETIGVPLAKDAVRELRAAGFIIVRHDAIRLAQAHARADNDPVQSYERARPNMRAKAA